MYPSTSLFIAVGQLAIVILVLFSYPLQVHPCRNCLDKVFHNKPHDSVLIKPSNAVVTTSDEDDEEDETVVDDEHSTSEMSPLKHTLLTAAIISAGFTIAYFVDDLKLGKSLMGCLSSVRIHLTDTYI